MQRELQKNLVRVDQLDAATKMIEELEASLNQKVRPHG